MNEFEEKIRLLITDGLVKNNKGNCIKPENLLDSLKKLAGLDMGTFEEQFFKTHLPSIFGKCLVGEQSLKELSEFYNDIIVWLLSMGENRSRIISSLFSAMEYAGDVREGVLINLLADINIEKEEVKSQIYAELVNVSREVEATNISKSVLNLIPLSDMMHFKNNPAGFLSRVQLLQKLTSAQDMTSYYMHDLFRRNSQESDCLRLLEAIARLSAEQLFELMKLQDQGGWTFIKTAFRHQQKAVCLKLLEAIARLSEEQLFELMKLQDQDGWTFIQMAFRNQQEAVCLKLLEAIARLSAEQLFELMKLQDQGGWTFIQTAFRHQQKAVCLKLLEAIARLSEEQLFELMKLQAKDGWTFIKTAFSHQQEAVCLKLLEAIARLSEEQLFELMKLQDQDGWTFIQTAFRHQQKAVCLKLLEAIARLSVEQLFELMKLQNQDDWTFIQTAFRNQQEAVCLKLLEAIARLSVEQLSKLPCGIPQKWKNDLFKFKIKHLGEGCARSDVEAVFDSFNAKGYVSRGAFESKTKFINARLKEMYISDGKLLGLTRTQHESATVFLDSASEKDPLNPNHISDSEL